MHIKENDSVVSAEVVGADQTYLMTVSENGLGKITEISEYREQ
jgi:DNA gyrase subunit A